MVYIANLAGCGPISVNGPAPSDPLDSQPSMNDTKPVNTPTSTPSPIADTGRERARTRILRATHSSKWSSPSQEPQPGQKSCPHRHNKRPVPDEPKVLGYGSDRGEQGQRLYG